MIKKASRRFLVLSLVLVFLMSQMPASFAADGLTVEGLGATTSGGSWTLEGTDAQGQLNVDGGCSGDTGSASLTLKNNKDMEATLTFYYEASATNGTVKINGNEVTGTGSFNEIVAAGDTVVIQLDGNAPSNETASCSINLSSIKLLVDKQITVKFTSAQNGSYTVDGHAAPYTFTGSTLDAHAVNAAASSGYRFFAWYNETTQSYIYTNASDTMYFGEDATIHPVFVSDSLAIFQVGTNMFYDLNEAITYATTSGSNTIIAVSNGMVPAGNYTIPSDKTLLVPMNDNNQLFTTSPASSKSNTGKASAYRQITLASGATITVNGAISVAGEYFAANGGSAGRMINTYGQIIMQEGSEIHVNNGARLYAWGYVTGQGTVTAESGSTVYEWFQLTDFRGGSETGNVGNRVFPFSQYYVQNIEASITLKAGATEKLQASLTAMSSVQNAAVEFIGSNGMFKLTSGKLTKRYNGTTDRLEVSLNGVMNLSNLAVNVSGLSVNSKDYVLPVTNNISLNVNSGSMTLTQDTALQPGVEINIAKDAVVNVENNANVYVYDSDEWGNFCGAGGKGQFIPLPYAPGRSGSRSNSDMKDVKLDINGTFNATGKVYTTAGGANICSTQGTGLFVLNSAPGTATETHQYQGSTDHPISITAARLKNADGSFTETSEYKSGDQIYYTNGKWGDGSVTVTFDANGGTGTMEEQITKLNTETTLENNTFTRSGYEFTGWNTEADGTGTSYTDGATVNLTENVTLYAQWECLHEQVEIRNEKDATCSEEGYTGDTFCKICGEKLAEGEAVNKLDHTPVKDDAVAPTCTKAGLTEGSHCSVCGEILVVQQSVPATGHDWNDGEVTTTPSCEGAGVKTFTCTVCGETRTEAVSATGHMPVKVSAVAPTCTEAGYTEGHKCSICDSVLDGCEEIPARGHTVAVNEAVAPTCTETGLTEGSHCSVCGKVLVAQEIVSALGHTPETISAVAPTCTEAGNTEGHKCSVCSSVLDGCEEIPALGHTEELRGYVEPTLSEPGYTGDKYCSVCEELLEQGQAIPRTGADVTWIVDGMETVIALPIGEVPVFDGVPAKAETMTATYTFTGWTPEITALTDEGATYTAVFEENVKSGWISWDNSFYYIENGEPVKGVAYVPYPTKAPEGYGPRAADLSNANYPDTEKSLFVFDENTGAFLSDINGLFEYEGATVWAVNGELPWYVGMVKDGENYHFFAPGREMVKSKDYWCHRLNDVKFDIDGAEVAPVQGGRYTFDDEGNLMKLCGVVDLNDTKYFYNNYCKDKSGLFEYNGDYYYAKSNSELVYGRDFWVSNTNGLVDEGTYTFDADGKMKRPDTTKNGFVEEDGVMHYYIDGKMQKDKGLIEIDGAYYYIRYTGEVVRNRTFWVTNHNGIVKEGKYAFDADGKIQLPDTSKNGFIEEDGVMHYYIDGEMQKDKGLIEIDGAYYYIRWTGEVVRGRTFWVTNPNGIVPEGKYVFNMDGTMVMP